MTVRYEGPSMPPVWRRRLAEVALNPSVPWELSIRRGAVDVQADLRGLRLGGASISGGARDVEVLLPKPTRPVAVRVGGGARSLRLLRPSGVPIRLHIGGGSSKLQFDEQAFGAIGGGVRLQSDAFEGTSASYDIRVVGGASRLTVGTPEIDG